MLESASHGKQRAIAADALGFASQSPRQIAALFHSSRDANDDVRNNATRALLELAQAGPAVASQIPPDTFIDMLWSGVWSDRNKAGGLFWILTVSRDPKLSARMILGRIAGIPGLELFKLANEDPSKIPGILPAPAASKP